MVMENSSLNKAHQQQRRAEALLHHRKFDESIECHKNAIELLMQSMSLTDNKKSLESIKLQKDYHAKQIDTIRMKKIQYENYKRSKTNPDYAGNLIDFNSDSSEDALQTAIFHKMEVQDSLIGRLEKRGTGSDYDSFSTSDTDEKSSTFDKIDGMPNAPILGNKHPKDDRTTIEELKILSGQLHQLVHNLVTQLNERTKENEMLKSRIKQLENERNNGHSKSNSLKVVTDSSGGTSPYVFSPSSELSPDVHEIRSLPSLAPLEMPNFDFNAMFKNSNTNNN